MKVTTLLLILSVILNIVLLYRIFDISISLDHSRIEQNLLRKRSENAVEVVNELMIQQPMTLSNLKEIVSKYTKQGRIVKSNPGELQVNDIVIKYDKDRILSVTYIPD